MKKLLFPLLCAASLMMAGCRAADPDPVTLSPSASPMTSTAPAATMPMASSNPMTSPGTGEGLGNGMGGTTVSGSMAGTVAGAMTGAMGVTSPAQAKRISEEAEDELEKLSEVSDAQVVVIGDKAVVALDFDSQYKSGVDDRLRKMVKERIDGLVKGVKDVIIVEDNATYERLEAMGDRFDAAATLDELERELDTVIAEIQA